MTDGLNNKTSQLITLLTATNEKLDRIITLLGGVPSTPQHTIDDLYTILDDIHTDTQSMDGKLLAIRNYIKSPDEAAIPGDYTSLLWNIYLLRRSIGLDSYNDSLTLQNLLVGIREYLGGQLPPIGTNINDTKNYLFYALSSLGLNVTNISYDYNGYLDTTLRLLQLIQGAIGVPVDELIYPDRGQRNIIQLLEKAAERPEGQIGGGLAPDSVCTDAYISSGMVLIPSLFDAWPPTLWAIFPAPTPSGISFGTIFGIGVDNSELHPTSNNWVGWSIYVASSANNFGVFIGADINASIARYPTNTWINLSFLTTNLSVFVGGSESLRVWLCGGQWGPGGGGGGPWGGGGGGGGSWGDCTIINSQETIITNPNNSTNTIQYIPMSSVPNTNFTNSLSIQGGEQYTTTANDYAATDNWNGVTIQLISGSGVRAFYQKSDLTFVIHTFTAINETFTIPEDCIKAVVDDYTGGFSTQFTVKICPPGMTP